MANFERRASVFHIDQIAKTSTLLFARNILLWLVIALVLDVLSMRFADELRTTVTSYMTERFHFSPDLSRFSIFLTDLSLVLPLHDGFPCAAELPCAAEFLACVVVQFTWFFALIILLQAMVSHLVFHAVKDNRSQISLADAASFLTKEGFLVDLLRVIGITTWVYLLMIGWLVVVVYLGTMIGTWYVLGVVFVLMLSVAMYLAIRWALAIPVAVIENRGVFQSIARSYRLTRSCWVTVGVIQVIMIVAFFVLAILVGMALEFGSGNAGIEAVRFVFWMALSVLAVIVLAVCYYYVSVTVPET